MNSLASPSGLNSVEDFRQLVQSLVAHKNGHIVLDLFRLVPPTTTSDQKARFRLHSRFTYWASSICQELFVQVGWFHGGGSSDVCGHTRRLFQALASPYHTSSLAPLDCIDHIETIVQEKTASSVLEAAARAGHKATILFNYILCVISSRTSGRHVPELLIPLLKWLSESTRRIFATGNAYKFFVIDVTQSHVAFYVCFLWTESQPQLVEYVDNDVNWISFGTYSGKYRVPIRRVPHRLSSSQEPDADCADFIFIHGVWRLAKLLIFFFWFFIFIRLHKISPSNSSMELWTFHAKWFRFPCWIDKKVLALYSTSSIPGFRTDHHTSSMTMGAICTKWTWNWPLIFLLTLFMSSIVYMTKATLVVRPRSAWIIKLSRTRTVDKWTLKLPSRETLSLIFPISNRVGRTWRKSISCSAFDFSCLCTTFACFEIIISRIVCCHFWTCSRKYMMNDKLWIRSNNQFMCSCLFFVNKDKKLNSQLTILQLASCRAI